MMKKITLLLTAVLLGFYLNAQVFYFQDDFVAGDMSQWTTVDGDGDGNNWMPATSDAMNGDCINSDSWTSALGGLTPNNYITTTSAIAIPTTAGTTLKFRVGTFQVSGAYIADRYTVYLSDAADTTSALAGDIIYDGILSDVMTADVAGGSASFYEHEFDLIALGFGGTNKFLTFRSWDTFDENSVLIGNVAVSSPYTDDLKLNTVLGPVTQGSGCQLGNETVSANVTNNGVNAITTFDATYRIFNGLTGDLIDSVFETVTVASIALDENVDFNFTTPTSDLSATDIIYTVEVSVAVAGDQDSSNDTLGMNVASIATQAVPYNTSFNIFDATGAIPDLTAWGWSSDGDFLPTFLGSASNGELLIDGECSLFTGGQNAWAFSPCVATTIGSNYRVTFQARTNQFTSGDAVPEVLEVGFGDGANSGAMTVIRLDSLNDNSSFTTFVYDFAATTATTNIGIHNANPFSFVSVEEFSVTSLAAPAVVINNSSVNPCTGLGVLGFNYETGNTYEISWGDGTIDTVMGSPANHTYTATGTQNITITATNISGSSNESASVDNTLAAPTAAFTITQNGTTVSVTSGETTPCNTYAWNFGDANTATGSSASNTYAGGGTYTITLTATNATGTFATNQTVTIVGINEIDFVNVNIFPNPVNDVLNVNFDLNNTQDITISLVTIDGKIVNSITNRASSVKETINTSALATGMYILNITTDEGIFTKTVLVK